MTQKEVIQRNIGLTFDFVHYLIEHKEEMEKLPQKFNVNFIEKDFSKIEKPSSKISNKSNFQNKYIRVKNSFETV